MDHRISKLDLNFFAVDSPTTPQTIGGLFELNGPVDPQLIKKRLDSVVPLFSKLKLMSNVSSGVWEEDPQFSIERHVKHQTSSGDTSAIFAQLLASPVPQDRPPWQLAVISSPGPITTTLIFTFHHSFTDGIGALAFIFSLFDGSESASKASSAQLTSVFERLPETVTPFKLLPRLRRLTKDLGVTKDDSPLVGKNSPARNFYRFEIPIASIKAKRLAVGCASNDMILAALGFSLKKYCLQINNGRSLKNVRAVIPFNRRTKTELNLFSNYLAGMGILLPLELPNVESMAAQIGARLTAAKFSGEYGAYGLLADLNSILPIKIRRRIAVAAAHRTSLICTNMPGPRTPLYLDGAKLTAAYGSAALMPGHGIAVSFLNMRDKLCCAILTDPAIVPHGETIAREFQQIFNDQEVLSAHP